MTALLDLDAYLARTACARPLGPDLPSLRRLHFAHATAIPFENLDIQMGLTVRLDLESLQAKLVRQRRGGYCFEQNTLFLHALRAVGFNALPCEARVRQGVSRVLPRTHMVLVVSVDGRDWLADVGFGGDGLVEPVAMDGSEHDQAGRIYRVAQDGLLRILQRSGGTVWDDLYAFVAEERYPVDFEVSNWFTSTFPGSVFVNSLTAQRMTGEARHILRNLSYTVVRGQQSETHEIAREGLVSFLRVTFGLDVPANARFRALDQ